MEIPLLHRVNRSKTRLTDVEFRKRVAVLKNLIVPKIKRKQIQFNIAGKLMQFPT